MDLDLTLAHAAARIRSAALGADALLVVAPYYNKPTQEGLYRHFRAIAESVDIPCVVYNIKGRTGVNVETPTLMRLIDDCDNIVGVKEASGNMSQIRDVINQSPDGFSILSGDDNITLALIRSGGDGVIAVTSNLVPDRMAAMLETKIEHVLARLARYTERSEAELEILRLQKQTEAVRLAQLEQALALEGLGHEVEVDGADDRADRRDRRGAGPRPTHRTDPGR